MRRDRPTGWIGGFSRDRRGVAAVEFALIAPFLMILYLGFVELTSAVTIHRKVQRVAATVSDLTARETAIDRAALDDIMEIGEAIMQPYEAKGLRIKVMGLERRPNDKLREVWSRSSNGKGTRKNPGKNANTEAGFMIQVDVTYPYTPWGRYAFDNPITMTGSGLAKVRIAKAIDCKDCAK